MDLRLPEILVHIAAPSSLRDDVRYRAQVHALLAFQPAAAAERITIERSSPQAAARSADSARHAAISTPDAIQPVGSEARPQPPQCPHPDSWDESPVSVIPDSQPDAAIPADCPPSDSTPSPSGAARVDSPRDTSSPGGDSDTAQQQGAEKEKQAEENAPAPSLAHLPLRIQSPLPPISTNAFTSHITPTLAMLAARLRSARTYSPLHQTRPLDRLERGHWFVPLTLVEDARSVADPNTWDTVFFSRFWAFLSDFITEQRAGWGVWCILEDAREGDRPPPAKSLPRNTLLKVYAWGEIATHIYLLLFLASERRIRKMGAQWRDGGDKVVIQMPSYTSSLVKDLADGI